MPVPRPGGAVPHFTATTLGGEPFSYADVWQHRNLVLVVLPPSDAAAAYAATFAAMHQELTRLNAATVIAGERVAGLVPPALLIADRWGEVVYVAGADDVKHLPSAADVIDWLEYTEQRCPECEGETR